MYGIFDVSISSKTGNFPLKSNGLGGVNLSVFDAATPKDTGYDYLPYSGKLIKTMLKAPGLSSVSAAAFTKRVDKEHAFKKSGEVVFKKMVRCISKSKIKLMSVELIQRFIREPGAAVCENISRLNALI